MLGLIAPDPEMLVEKRCVLGNCTVIPVSVLDGNGSESVGSDPLLPNR